MVEAQVFVKIDNYKDVLRTVGLIKNKLNETKNTLEKIKDLKQQEDSELEGWDAKLVEIENKITGIDTILFEPSL
jgi:DNA integrity scanning protein DisA with diadenylate cyclase activity